MRRLIPLLALFILTTGVARAQISGAGNIGCSGVAVVGTVINSSTANNTVVSSLSNFQAWGVLVQLDQTTTITGGVVTFQESFDGGSNYITVPVAQVLNVSTFAQLTNPYTLVASTNQSFLIPLYGATNFQVKLTTSMTGTGAITPNLTAICSSPGPVALDSSGNLLVKLAASSLSNQSVNVAQVAGTTTDTNSGTKSGGTQRVVLATDQPQLTNKLLVTPDADVETIPVATATTTNTALRCTLVSAASTNATNCKNGSGNVYGYRFVNTTQTVYYLRMYNLTTSPTCSSATGFIESIPIPPGSSATTSGGVVAMEPFGEGYSTGIGFCFTGGSSSTDATNAAVGVFGTILYK